MAFTFLVKNFALSSGGKHIFTVFKVAPDISLNVEPERMRVSENLHPW